MTMPPVAIYIEEKPQAYSGPISITIRCRPDEQLEAEHMRAIIEDALRPERGEG